MATAHRIERERAAKRALILEAARELFVEHGYDAVTVRQLAQRIEYSTTAIYVHFKDKRDLFHQLVQEDFARFDAALIAHADVVDPVDRLERMGRSYVDFAMTMPRHYQLLFMREWPAEVHVERPDPVESTAGQGAYAALVSTCVDCLQQGRLRPELQDPFAVAQAIWSGVHGLVSLLIMTSDAPKLQWRSRDTVLDVLMTMTMRGVLREPGA